MFSNFFFFFFLNLLNLLNYQQEQQEQEQQQTTLKGKCTHHFFSDTLSCDGLSWDSKCSLHLVLQGSVLAADLVVHPVVCPSDSKCSQT